MILKTDKIETEAMKIEIIELNCQSGQIINIPINGNITILSPSMIQPSSRNLGSLNPEGFQTHSNANQKPADVKMETDQAEISILEK